MALGPTFCATDPRLGVLELARQCTGYEPRSLGALAAEFLTFVLLQRDAQVGQRLLDFRRPHQSAFSKGNLEPR